MCAENKYELALRHLVCLLQDRNCAEAPEALAGDPDYRRLEEMIRMLRDGALALGRGDLDCEIEGRGYAIGALKGLQGALRHLVWQCREIATGDFEQKVDFLGDLSEAYNQMALALGERTEALARSEAKYRMLFENAAESIAVVVDGRVALANPIFEKLNDVESGRLADRPFFELFSEEDRRVAAALGESLLEGKPQQAPVTLRIAAREGFIWLETKGVPIDWAGQKALIFFLMDVTQRKRAESALSVSEEKYRLMAENAQDVIWVLDLATGRFTYVSPSVFSLLGVTVEEALKAHIADSMPPESYARFDAYLKKRTEAFLGGARDGENSVVEVEQYASDGATVYTEVSVKLRLNACGGLEAVGISRDITVRKSSERKILYINQHDPLTDLYNRRHYNEQLSLLNTADNMPLSLVLIDVNGMKLMNDAFGHMVGDKLLTGFAQVLKSSLRASDIAARIGGDEFVLLLPRTDAKAAERVVRRIKAALIDKAVEDIAITASFGLATKHLVEEDFGGIYRMAEDNMYREKLSTNRQLKADLLQQILDNLYRKSQVERRHSEAVSRLCMAIGREFRMSVDDIEKLGATGLYHDIGKVALDEGILNKPETLDPGERMEIKRHPEISYQILRSFAGMGEIADCVLMHHRRVDGTGYPEAADGDLPFEARILAVAEAYDMMTGKYPFGPAFTAEQAIQELERNAGSQFDAKVVRVFIDRVLRGGAPPGPNAAQENPNTRFPAT